MSSKSNANLREKVKDSKDIYEKKNDKSTKVKNKIITNKVFRYEKKVDVKDKYSIISKTKNFAIKNKNIFLFLILIILDIILIIWCARGNYANYAKVDGESYFIGETKNLVFGRNYVGLIITVFIYIYGVLVNKFLIKNKISMKVLIVVLLGLLIFNMLLFYCFTNKVY